jgi:hypothetical protein
MFLTRLAEAYGRNRGSRELDHGLARPADRFPAPAQPDHPFALPPGRLTGLPWRGGGVCLAA